MRLTVAIYTWNRCDLLAKTLEEMTRLQVPDGVDWELLVVDNNSSDGTGEVVRRFADSLPLRSVLEEKAGLSNARNAAVSNARGRYIVWTDDDVLVSPNWLTAYSESFEIWPDAVFFGGPIEPWFDGDPPRWLKESINWLGGAYALQDLGEVAIPLTAEKIPYGANFAIRADVQADFLYDPRLGRVGHSLRGGEEVTVLRAILTAGMSGRWVPDARVRHWVPRERQTLSFLRRRMIAYGQLLASRDQAEGPKLLGRPRWLWRATAQAEVAYVYHRLFSPPREWVEALVRVATLRGRLWGSSRGGS